MWQANKRIEGFKLGPEIIGYHKDYPKKILSINHSFRFEGLLA